MKLFVASVTAGCCGIQQQTADPFFSKSLLGAAWYTQYNLMPLMMNAQRGGGPDADQDQLWQKMPLCSQLLLNLTARKITFFFVVVCLFHFLCTHFLRINPGQNGDLLTDEPFGRCIKALYDE